ncbi:lytic transglycosylase domain-containing protein [Sphingomonas sp. PL-96]|uniref:lytic transglycosylase domain-containing protein n=1 Tax=Sphingomonas sp. PL-96 TaxID=2887201 RepID=UPI001E509A7A|nr:lytic transglycosylase domain-containing protein [Sphingomonas sp. PL-96]MCC2977144.1 lytic transglycosylase domain-containing protein [Sphingomonas sp. PL-96]
MSKHHRKAGGGALRAILAAACLAAAAPAHAQAVADWRSYTVEASARFGVPVEWIEAVMQAESVGRTRIGGRPIRSSAGAMGLMQLMPTTWAEMRARLGLGQDPDDPRDNILAGTFYLRLMYEQFGYPGLFAAYNAGPARYAEHLAGRRALPAETVGYLTKVAPARVPVASVAAASPPLSIFAVRLEFPSAGSEERRSAPSSSLFVALSQQD